MKRDLIFRGFCLILTLLLLAGCGIQGSPETTVQPTDTQPQATVPTFPEGKTWVTTVFISLSTDGKELRSINVYGNEDGSVRVEFVGEEKKVGDFSTNALHGMYEAFRESKLDALNGKDSYGDGAANASMYVEFSDGTLSAVGYSGTIPQEYINGYQVLEDFFTTLTASLPVYVPQPVILGEVEERLLNPVMEILALSGVEALDAFAISQLPMDEYFAAMAGLSSDQGITGAVSCGPMMSTFPFSLVIVDVAEGDPEAVCKDFEDNLDWRKWVCVAPSNALICTKGQLVLCLMAQERDYILMSSGITDAGWTQIAALENPDM